MYKILAKSIRQYKKASFMASFYVVLEVIIRCIIPFILANLVDNIETERK